MLSAVEIQEIQEFYSNQAELEFLEEAVYFQKMLIMKHHFDDVVLRVTDNDARYTLTARQMGQFALKGPALADNYDGVPISVEFMTYLHMLFSPDFINLQMVFDLREVRGISTEAMKRKTEILLSRTKYLKGIQMSEDDGTILLYLWVGNGRNYTSMTMENTIKDFIWLKNELSEFIETQSARSKEWREE